MSVRFRIYADGNVVHEDEFWEYDNGHPYYDDYSEHEVSDEIDIYELAQKIQESEKASWVIIKDPEWRDFWLGLLGKDDD